MRRRSRSCPRHLIRANNLAMHRQVLSSLTTDPFCQSVLILLSIYMNFLFAYNLSAQALSSELVEILFCQQDCPKTHMTELVSSAVLYFWQSPLLLLTRHSDISCMRFSDPYPLRTVLRHYTYLLNLACGCTQLTTHSRPICTRARENKLTLAWQGTMPHDLAPTTHVTTLPTSLPPAAKAHQLDKLI